MFGVDGAATEWNITAAERPFSVTNAEGHRDSLSSEFDAGKAAGGVAERTDLVDLFEIAEPARQEILNEVRKKTIYITHPEHGTAAIRDQLPLKFLSKVLTA